MASVTVSHRTSADTSFTPDGKIAWDGTTAHTAVLDTDADFQSRKRKSIFKPTGLPPYRETVERLVKETREIHREVRREILSLPKPPKLIKQMSLAEIESEIGQLLQEQIKKEDEEIVLMLLAATVAG